MSLDLLRALPEALSEGDAFLTPFAVGDDVDELYAALTRAVWEHVPGGAPADPAELRRRMVARISGNPPLCRTWLIRHAGAVVGTTSHFVLPEEPDALEIGATYMAPSTWGSGLNARIKRLMIEAARNAGATRIVFQTDERNRRSARAIAKLGALPRGTRLEKIIRPDGSVRTSLLFELALDEIPLAGGNASGAVVRIGDTVRKPWTPSTPSVADFVRSLRESGIDVPRIHGRDEQGRQIIEYVEGPLAMDRDPFTHAELQRVGAMVRAIHDASASYASPADAPWETLLEPPDARLICHNDLAPWNLLTGERWVFIDWDGAGPSTRLWDLAYAAQTFTLNAADRDPHEAARDLAAFVDGYRADEALRAALPHTMHRRAAAMHRLLRTSHEASREPWASMYVAGHGEHWKRVAEYVEQHEGVWAAALLP